VLRIDFAVPLVYPECSIRKRGESMIYIIYAVLAAAVVFCSNKAAQYVDILEKRTRLSGAFLGGVLLSAITSLPELFTSLSATLMLHEPGLCLGNVLGSDLFNLVILAVLSLIYLRRFRAAHISPNHAWVSLFVCLIYGVLLLNLAHWLDWSFNSISITTVIIFVLYFCGVRRMSGENEDAVPYERQQRYKDVMPLKTLVIRFSLVSIGIVFLSIAITYVTDEIADRLGLQTGLAGALLLGIATSLPELTSTVSLYRIGNCNIAVGNIIGSNLFNFIILGIADLFYFGRGLYEFSESSTINLLVFGALAMLLYLIMLRRRNTGTIILSSAGTLCCYAAFLLV
jgi:cation:H+ antiporter